MKRIISLLLALTLMVGCVCVLSSCGEKEEGAQIAVYLGDKVFDLDPSDYFVSDNAAQFMSLLFEPLFSLDAEGELQMAAAEEYEIDAEAREIRILLRESYWSDGTRVSPNDFICAWERLLDPKNANPAAALLYGIEGAYDVKSGATSSLYDAEANNYGDDKTILIKYREGADVDALLANLASIATAPVRKSAVESASTFWTKSIVSIVTNGPFTLASYSVEDEKNDDGEMDFACIRLERNRGYHQSPESKKFDKQVKPYQLVNFWGFEEGKEVKLTYDDIANKTVFFLGDATKAARANASLKEAIVAKDTLSTFTFAFVSENELFNDVDLRKAMSMALDRDAIAAALVYAKAATGFLPQTVLMEDGTPFAAKTLIKTSAELTAAKALLPEEAKGLEIRVALNDDTNSRIIGELVKKAWTDLGLKVEIDYLGVKKIEVFDKALNGMDEKNDSHIQYLVKTFAEGAVPVDEADRYDLIGFDWQMYSADPFVGLASLSPSMNGNGAEFGNEGAVSIRSSLAVWSAKVGTEYDKRIENAYNSKIAEKRQNQLVAAASLIAEDVPVIPVVFNQSIGASADGLSRVGVDYFGNFSFTRAKQK